MMIYIQDGLDGLPITLGLAAATGLGIFAFTEVNHIVLLIVLYLLEKCARGGCLCL